MAFNPNEHVMQLKSKEGSKDYLPVQWRLVWFREACPDGTIETQEVEIDLDREMEEEVYAWNAEKRRSEKIIKRAKGYARFRATVTDGRGGRATGTKSECAASFPDYIEKAETGAIGRALAALGYGTQFAPEFNEGPRIVDSPVEARQSPPQEQQPRRPVVEAVAGMAHPSPSDIDMVRNLVGRVFSFKDADFEQRWEAAKMHVLVRATADPDLSASDIGKLRAFAEAAAEKKATASTSAGAGR